MRRRRLGWSLLLSTGAVCRVNHGFVEAFGTSLRDGLPGIWRLITDINEAQLTPGGGAHLLFRKRGANDDGKGGIVLIISEDGSFHQSGGSESAGAGGRRVLSGSWDLVDNEQDANRLVLALDRRHSGTEFDVALQGTISPTLGSSSLAFRGKIYQGRFMYPRTHPSFFDDILLTPTTVGSFRLEQTVASRAFQDSQSTTLKDADPSSESFRPSDFHGRRFYMTIEPIKYVGDHQDDNELDPAALAVDIRAMPLHFYANNTFQAWGVNKVLRGRFTVDGDRLSFDVSLFGAGRSMKGSVYSEGIGLSHEDKRSYAGSIQKSKGRLFVDGSVTFGSDLGTDARPEPVGRFLLTEITEAHEEIGSDDGSFDDLVGAFQ